MFDEYLSPLFTTRWGRNAGIGTVVVLALLILFTLISAITSWSADIKAANRPISAKKSTNPNELSLMVAQIPDWHLFGRSDSAAEVIPVSSLPIKLLGIIHAVPESMSRVLISESGQRGKSYRVGDTLPIGVKVYTITPDGVILENAGRLEKLPLQRNTLEFQGMPKPIIEKQEP